MAEATARLERALVNVGHPLTRHWQPGLSTAEVDALMRPIGVTLPVEAAAWWQWHDGTQPWSAGHPPGAHELPGHCTPVPLRGAIELHDAPLASVSEVLPIEARAARTDPYRAVGRLIHAVYERTSRR